MAEIGIPAGAPAEAAGRRDHGRRARPRPPARAPNSTKFDSGQVLVIGGSRGLTGAVCMAAEAAIRVGAGYATVAVPADLEPIFEVKLTEVMSRGFAGAEGRLAAARPTPSSPRPSARPPWSWARGWGATRTRWSSPARLAQRIEAPLLIDADGLNAHAERLELDRRASRADRAHASRRRARAAARARVPRGGRAPARLRARGGGAKRGDRPAQGRRLAGRRRRAARDQRRREPRPRHRRHRRRALRHDRGAARSGHGALRGRLRRASTRISAPGGSPPSGWARPSR